MVTIKDIAREVNLSYSSVSLALNDDPRIKKDTKKRVKLKAEEMGYQRNAQARALVMNKSEMIGFILPDIENPFFASLIRVEKVLSMHLPLVFVSSPYPEAKANFVGTDSENGGYMAAKHLLELGHREFVVIGGQFNSKAIIQRFNGYKRALNEYNIILNKDDVLLGDFSVNSGYRSIKSLLNTNRKFTAVLAFDDLIAIGVMNGIKESGITIPDDISVIGFDNIEAASFRGIDLTTISMDKSSMGRLAVEILLGELNCKQKPCDIKNIVLDQDLVIRIIFGCI